MTETRLQLQKTKDDKKRTCSQTSLSFTIHVYDILIAFFVKLLGHLQVC